MPAVPFLLCLTASITVGHATGRERVQVAFQRSKGRSEFKDGIGPTPMPATQPHPLVRVGHTTCNKQRKTNENHHAKRHPRRRQHRSHPQKNTEPPAYSVHTCAMQTCAMPTCAVQTYRNSPSPKPASFRLKATSSAGKSPRTRRSAHHRKTSHSIRRKTTPTAPDANDRANKARILDLQDRQGNSLPPDTTAYSSFDPDFTYKKGETVHVEDFDTNRWNECAPGIHFFITRIEAVKY